MTAVQPPGRFGSLHIQDHSVTSFLEKPIGDGGWINGGFFVVNSEIENHINSEIEPLEAGALPRLARLGQMKAFKHSGFWRGIDTLRDRNEIDVIARSHNKPWLVVNEQ
jgi:glucose-1-phosphate cytidylyltransferase